MNTEDMRQHFEADGSPRRLDSMTDAGVGSGRLLGVLPRPYYEDAHVALYHGDCREILPLLGRSEMA